MATLSAQSVGDENGYTLPEVEVCGCQICGEQIDCEDREFHEWLHQKEQEEEAEKENDLNNKGQEGDNDNNTGNGDTGVSGGGENGNENTSSENNNQEVNKTPCITEKNGELISTPVASPTQLQPANENNINGATYGNTRTNPNGSPRFHKGIDIAANVGDPIFAVYDGTVTKIVDTQVNRISSADDPQKYVYPNSYTGTDKDGAGNRIYITSVVNGVTITIGYWHLQENTATTKPVADGIEVGTIVHAGDIIGYVGQTGNAMGGEPHLHISAQNASGEFIDPEPYLNITLDRDDEGQLKSVNITTPCD